MTIARRRLLFFVNGFVVSTVSGASGSLSDTRSGCGSSG